jgi:Holliday junction resolvasome RuvABC endonuclease subunit
VPPGARLSKLFDRLVALHERERFERVGFERPFQGPNATAVEALRHFEAMVLFWTFRAGLPCAGYQPSEVKRAVATGKVSKPMMIERVRALNWKTRRGPHSPRTHKCGRECMWGVWGCVMGEIAWGNIYIMIAVR